MSFVLSRFFFLYRLLHAILLHFLPKKLGFLFNCHSKVLEEEIVAEESKEKKQSTENVDMKEVFQMFDRNGDGRICKTELRESFKNLGIFISDEELEKTIETVDVNGDGCLDIEEFRDLYKTVMEEKEEDMREAFNVFDQNGDGFITVEELMSVMSSLGMKQGRTVEDCRRIIQKVDKDGNEMVDFNEFIQMMTRMK